MRFKPQNKKINKHCCLENSWREQWIYWFYSTTVVKMCVGIFFTSPLGPKKASILKIFRLILKLPIDFMNLFTPLGIKHVGINS